VLFRSCGVLNGIPPVAGVDYVVSGGSASVNVAWRGADAVVTITNTSGSSIIVSFLQLRGTPVTSYQSVQFNSTSGVTPKKTKWHTAPVLTNILAATSYADWLLTLFNDVTADSRQATIYPSSPDTLEEMCQVDMNTRLTVSGTQIAHVNWVHHQIGPGYHFLTVGISPAVVTTMWILGTSQLGTDTALGV